MIRRLSTRKQCSYEEFTVSLDLRAQKYGKVSVTYFLFVFTFVSKILSKCYQLHFCFLHWIAVIIPHYRTPLLQSSLRFIGYLLFPFILNYQLFVRENVEEIESEGSKKNESCTECEIFISWAEMKDNHLISYFFKFILVDSIKLSELKSNTSLLYHHNHFIP